MTRAVTVPDATEALARHERCEESPNHQHDWGGFDRSLCFCEPNGVMHTFCTYCDVTDSAVHEAMG